MIQPYTSWGLYKNLKDIMVSLSLRHWWLVVMLISEISRSVVVHDCYLVGTRDIRGEWVKVENKQN